MWAPVGGSGSQSICVIDKELDGTLKTEKIMDVRYGALTSVEQQLNDMF